MRSDEPGRRRFLRDAGVAGGALLSVRGMAIANETSRDPGKLFYDVTSFGAKRDGKTIDSPAIDRAIEAVAKGGGGTAYLPAGNYLCYSIRLRSKVTIYLEQGATIIAADPAEDPARGYDLAEPKQAWEDYQDYGHNH